MLNNRRRDTCSHNVYIKGLCGNCGIRLDPPQATSVSMIHSVPELKVSEDYAKEIGKADQERLIQERKLVLLVDLDQTILHTTHERPANSSLPNVHSFELWPGHPTYYTKLRPHLEEFLERMSSIYELHIFTFGCRMYAHKIASIIDPNKRYFGNRILSRDESVDQYSKRGNLNNLFPCGDAMVCIIDDRSDVWRDAGNLIQVRPYSYFKTSISDGAMMNNSCSSAEDDESLDADVDKLEALLGVEGDDDDDDEGGGEEGGQEEDKDGAVDEGDKAVASGDADDGDGGAKEEPSPPSPGSGHPSEEEEEAAGVTSRESSSNDQEDTQVVGTDEKTSPGDDDLDDHLLRLPDILSRIHEKWYMELDEQRRFLVDGENYKLPDIKDIIKRYLTKRYH